MPPNGSRSENCPRMKCSKLLHRKLLSTSDFQSEVGEVFGKIGGELPAKFGRRFSRAAFARENRQKHFPPKLHRKFHHQTSLRGSGLWQALEIGVAILTAIWTEAQITNCRISICDMGRSRQCVGAKSCDLGSAISNGYWFAICDLEHLSGKSKWGLSKWGLKVLVHNWLSTIAYNSGRGWGQQFSLFRVRRFTEGPGPLHWIAFPVEILTKPPIHWIASPLFTVVRYFRKPLRGPPTHGAPKPPSNKKRNSKNPENPDYPQK